MKESDELPDMRFGDAPPANWRDPPDDGTPDDDEELPETPPDVVKMLGFDPLHLEDQVTKADSARERSNALLGRFESRISKLQRQMK